MVEKLFQLCKVQKRGKKKHLHDDAIGTADGNVVRMFQLTGPVAHSAEFSDKSAIWLENLHSMVFLLDSLV